VLSVDLLIRPAVPSDARSIADIRIAGWRTAYAGLLEQHVLDAMDPAVEAERRRREWSTSPWPGTLDVAVATGSVAGFVLTGPYRSGDDEAAWPTDPHAGEVAALYVDPAVHGRGIGRALLTHALTELITGHYTVARLWTLTGNTRARRVYTAAGFTDESPAGVVKTFTPRGATRGALEVRYSRHLPDRL